MKLFSALILAFSVLAIGACASSPQQRQESFHKMVHSTHAKKVRINRLDNPPTCWMETAPPSHVAMYMYREVSCEQYQDQLIDP